MTMIFQNLTVDWKKYIASDNENISEFNSNLEKNVASDNDNIAEFNSNLEKNIAPNNDNDISEFNVDLAKDIESDTSGEFTHLLVFQLNGLREVREVNPILAKTEAEELNHVRVFSRIVLHIYFNMYLLYNLLH